MGEDRTPQSCAVSVFGASRIALRVMCVDPQGDLPACVFAMPRFVCAPLPSGRYIVLVSAAGRNVDVSELGVWAYDAVAPTAVSAVPPPRHFASLSGWQTPGLHRWEQLLLCVPSLTYQWLSAHLSSAEDVLMLMSSSGFGDLLEHLQACTVSQLAVTECCRALCLIQRSPVFVGALKQPLAVVPSVDADGAASMARRNRAVKSAAVCMLAQYALIEMLAGVASDPGARVTLLREQVLGHVLEVAGLTTETALPLSAPGGGRVATVYDDAVVAWAAAAARMMVGWVDSDSELSSLPISTWFPEPRRLSISALSSIKMVLRNETAAKFLSLEAYVCSDASCCSVALPAVVPWKPRTPCASCGSKMKHAGTWHMSETDLAQLAAWFASLTASSLLRTSLLRCNGCGSATWVFVDGSPYVVVEDGASTDAGAMDLYWAREVQHAPLSPSVDGHHTCTCSRWLRSAMSTSPSVAVPLEQLFTVVRASFTPEMLSALVDVEKRSKVERQQRLPLVQAALCKTMTPTSSGSAQVSVEALLDPNTPFVSASEITVAPNQKTVRVMRSGISHGCLLLVIVADGFVI
jgi:hypothetical protein